MVADCYYTYHVVIEILGTEEMTLGQVVGREDKEQNLRNDDTGQPVQREDREMVTGERGLRNSQEAAASDSSRTSARYE